MQLHDLQRQNPYRDTKRVGRGRGSGKGKTSGRGTKGQNARAGHKKRPDVREKLKKLPKLRGYNFATIQIKPTVINVSALEAMFTAGDTVNPKTLHERGLIRTRRGKMPVVKLLGDGDLTKKIIVAGCTVSQSARQKIEKAGGTIE
jgi:large subunit ribosomal protein L15